MNLGEKIKAAAEQQVTTGGAYYEDCCNTQANSGGLVGNPLAVHRLQRQGEVEQQRSHLRDRVIDILTRHPEFEEFLEVLRSGMV